MIFNYLIYFCSGIAVLKSIFEEEITFEYNKLIQDAEKYGYEKDNLDYFDLKIKQENITKYLNLIKEAKKTVTIPVIASINCVSAYEWTYFTKKIVVAGADAIELNIFILPKNISKSGAEIENTYIEILQRVRKEVNVPLIVKMTSYFSNLSEMIQKISKTGVNGIVMFNRFFNPDIDINTLQINASNVFSSDTDYMLPLRWIAMSSGKTNCSLAASTGVHSGETLIKFILAGADAVEVVSAIYKHGAGVIKEMNKKLSSYVSEAGKNDLSGIKGLASQKNVKNPAIFERVQFMKYFSDYEDLT